MTHPKEPTMTDRLSTRIAAFMLALIVTITLAAGIDSMAQMESAPNAQMSQAAGSVQRA
jgi:hypothetical protein